MKFFIHLETDCWWNKTNKMKKLDIRISAKIKISRRGRLTKNILDYRSYYLVDSVINYKLFAILNKDMR